MFEHAVVQIGQRVQRPLAVNIEPAAYVGLVSEALYQLGLYSIMQKLPIIAALIMPLSLAFGQVDSNSITVTSSRSATSSTPDQAIYGVHVSSGLNTSLDDVVAALQGFPITAANLVALNQYSVFTGVTQTQMLDWWFTFTGPFAKTKDTIATLAGLQANIAKNSPTMTMSFSI
jgi:hypothetical protein